MVVSSAYLRLLLFLLAILIPACVSLYISLYIYRYDILLCFNPNLIIYISSCPSFPFGECTSFPGSSDGKESTCSVGDLGSIPGLERCPGEGKGYPLQYAGLENSLDCIVLRVAKSWTQLRDFHFHFFSWQSAGSRPCASVVVTSGLYSTDSIVVAYGLSSSAQHVGSSQTKDRTHVSCIER